MTKECLGKREKLTSVLVLAAMGCFLMLFFTKIHPLIIYDSDDWLYVSYRRNAIPNPLEWNPCKVLPETLLPLVSDFGAHIVHIFVKDYIFSLTIAYALCGSAVIVLFFLVLAETLKEQFGISYQNKLLVCMFVFLFCFSLYRSDWNKNSYVFWARNLNCFFNYVIPGILNAILIMIHMNNKEDKNRSFVQTGLVLVLTYLAVFSNLFHSAILVTYLGTVLLLNLSEIKNGIKEYVSKNKYELGTIVLWLLSLILESQGRRADQGNGLSMAVVADTFKGLLSWIKSINKFTGCVIVLAVVVALFCAIKGKRQNNSFIRMFRISAISGLLLLAFLVLLCSVVDSKYITRTDAMFGMSFWLLFVFAISFASIIDEYKLVLIISPFLLYLLLVNALNAGKTFSESNEMNISPEKCIAVDNDLISQIVEADKMGLEEMTLHVPVGVDDVNWPHALYMGGRFANTLSQHGVISKCLEVNVVADETMNEKYHLGY